MELSKLNVADGVGVVTFKLDDLVGIDSDDESDVYVVVLLSVVFLVRSLLRRDDPPVLDEVSLVLLVKFFKSKEPLVGVEVLFNKPPLVLVGSPLPPLDSILFKIEDKLVFPGFAVVTFNVLFCLTPSNFEETDSYKEVKLELAFVVLEAVALSVVLVGKLC